ncbi:prepilin-type N-terminal cleavage/methylation domain-containing protein [Patescibacteria group bacterium]|nr:prepilin-type N-terminal cleavage/methylation domain-containing protein [Patescibacteria group bacterium]
MLQTSDSSVSGHSSDKGFTLLEILVVVVIFGLLLGGAVANYRRLNERKIVEGAAKQVEQALRDAQKRASAGVKPSSVECDDPETLNSYVITMSGTGYQIQANCSGGSPSPSSYTLPQGTTIGSASAPTVTFNVLTLAATAATVCVQNTSGTLIFKIDVTDGGAISYQGQQICP